MARSAQQKLKLLYLESILEEDSDEQHPISTAQLIESLAALGISAERKAIYDDMEALREFGLDIVQVRGKPGGYFLASRDFELPELKLLVDAVQSCKFLSARKSMDLIAKLERLTSRYAATSLRRQVYVTGRVKTMNESIYYNVDKLHDAILHNSRITFQYFDWGVDRERHFRPGPYEASPYALCWNDENYYLIAHSPRHGMTHYRVDKMVSITQTGEERFLPEEARDLDLAVYVKKTFGMFSGRDQTVKLRFHNSLAGVVIDRFGRDSMLIPDGPDHFTLTAEVAVSPMFFSWVLMLGAKARILSPDSVVADFLKLCRETTAQYDVPPEADA
jgi:predicted DNA-binding transcriptional regulator YafY